MYRKRKKYYWRLIFSSSISLYFTSIGWYCTADSNVISVITIMDTPCPTCAVSKSVGSIRTREAIQPNLTSSLTIVSAAVEGIGFSVKWTELDGDREMNSFKKIMPQNTFIARYVVSSVDIQMLCGKPTDIPVVDKRYQQHIDQNYHRILYPNCHCEILLPARWKNEFHLQDGHLEIKQYNDKFVHTLKQNMVHHH